MTPEMKNEIMDNEAHYEQAIRCIVRRHKETDGMFCNGYFTTVAKEYHIKVRPLKALYKLLKDKGIL